MGPCYLSLGNAASLVLSSQVTTTNKNHRISTTTKVNITTYQNSKQITTTTRESETFKKSPPVDAFYSFLDTPPASEIEESYSEKARSSSIDQDDIFYYDQAEQDELYNSSTSTTTTDEALSEDKLSLVKDEVLSEEFSLGKDEALSEDEFSLGKDEVLSEEELSSDEQEKYNNKNAKSNRHSHIKTVNSTIHTNNNLITKQYVKHDTPSPPPLITSEKKILSFAKLIFSLKRPAVLRHDLTFVTGAMQYEIIKSHINIGSLTQSKLSGIITKSDFISFMGTYQHQRGRWIFVMKKEYRDLLAKEFNASLCN